MTLQQFYEGILAFHPVARQANLLPLEAKQLLREARGNFDPKVEIDFSRKFFADKTYYNFWDSYLKAPILPLGAELKAGYERNISDFPDLGPDYETPFDGLAYAGISLPIGQGLIIDARRNTLRQAEIYQGIADAERAKFINKLIFSAAKDYWNWYFAQRQLKLVQEGYNLADVRFRAIRERALAEEAAPIDTTEALITLQDREVQLLEAALALQNARIIVSNYLWDNARNPMELAPNVIPDSVLVAAQRYNEASLQSLLVQAENQHPEVMKFTLKSQQLGIEQRFRREMLKPQLNVSYNYLTYYPNLKSPIGSDNWNMFSQNYKVGMDFSFPVFLRKERGKLQQVKIKLLQNEFDLSQTRREILNEIRAAYNQLKNLEQQMQVLEQQTINQARLVEAEYQKFELGESTLFLINTRENKLIDFRIKLESLKTKYEKALAEIIFAAGAYQLP
ncbi:MAG: TolC family protein [Verrucomicrobia bacterium]|nr:TolC family protein [Cytophagales bacterium]